MRKPRAVRVLYCAIFLVLHLSVGAQTEAVSEDARPLSGTAAMGDWTKDAPGLRRRITVKDLPPPSSNVLAINRARVVERPAGAELQVPASRSRSTRSVFATPDICVPRRMEISSLRRVVPIKSRCCAIRKAAASPTSRKYLPSAI